MTEADQRALLGHEAGHWAARVQHCGFNPKTGRTRSCKAYKGEHNKKLYRVTEPIHRLMNNSKRSALKIERRAGYKPPRDYMDQASSVPGRRQKISLEGWYPQSRALTKEEKCLEYARKYTRSWREAFYVCLEAKNMGVHPREILRAQGAPITGRMRVPSSDFSWV